MKWLRLPAAALMAVAMALLLSQVQDGWFGFWLNVLLFLVLIIGAFIFGLIGYDD